MLIWLHLQKFRSKQLKYLLNQYGISKIEKKALSEIASNLQNKSTEDKLKQTIFDYAKANEIQPKRMFQLLYLLLIGKSQGPKIGTLILALGKERCMARLKEVA